MVGRMMIDFITHVYKHGSPPFQTLSELPEEQACAIMRLLYRNDSIFWKRFEDPASYLTARKQLERKLKTTFQAKGGQPKQEFPIYFMLGRPPWIDEVADAATIATTEEIEVPLSIFDKTEISFTYPDSMVSALIALERNPGYYDPEYHGNVFTLEEITEIVERKGNPGVEWKTNMPHDLAHYIEAQVWNSRTLAEFLMGRCG